MCLQKKFQNQGSLYGIFRLFSYDACCLPLKIWTFCEDSLVEMCVCLIFIFAELKRDFNQENCNTNLEDNRPYNFVSGKNETVL